ncbi:MAG TPA: hypothetical protein PK113_03310, partial [Bacillota bacterium]|nr:hypothetical protein [Bacillota bacterium]
PDVQYTYTFAGWDISFTNVQSALNVTAVYTTTLNQYTVTFYDFDGTTILSQGLVDYGTAATPPANPIKPDDTEWRYTFIGWNSGYNFITGDLELIPLFFKTSLSVFDRQALVDLVIEMFDAGDPDAVILMMQNVFSPGGTEEDLYNKLMAVQRLMVDLKGISNAGDLQNWLNEINLLGFDRTTMIDTLYSLSILGLQMNIQDMQDQILEKEDYIDVEYTNIDNYELALDSIQQQANDYCAVSEYSVECSNYFNSLVNLLNLYMTYDSNLYDNYQPEEFNWETYNYLAFNLNYYLYYSINYPSNPEWATPYLTNYNTTKVGLTPEEWALYEDLLAEYEIYRTAQYDFDMTDFSVLYNEYIYAESTYQYLWDLFYGPEWFTMGYEDYVYEIDSCYWYIQEYQWEIEDLQKRIANAESLLTYISDPANETTVKTLYYTAYDAVQAMSGEIDQEMFAFVMGIVGQLQAISSPTAHGIPYDPYMIFKEILSADNVLYASDKILDLINAFASTIDDDDIANIKVAVLGLLEQRLVDDGVMTDTEIDEAMVLFADKFDEYLGYADFAIGQVVNLLESMTIEKAAVVFDILTMTHYYNPTDIDSAIRLSTAFDTLIGDGSFDIGMIMQYVASIYFDVSSGFSADPLYVADIQSQIGDFFDSYLLLVSEVADYEPYMMSPDNIETAIEFFVRFYALQNWFWFGFEEVEEPLVVYQEWYLNDFMYYYLEAEDIDEAIAQYQDILGEVD